VPCLQTLAAGKLEEARQICAEQMEEMHAKLSSDAEYRAGRLRCWRGRLVESMQDLFPRTMWNAATRATR
jgi:hypothetical protein